MSPSFDLGEVETFTAGTVGEPGQRVFFLQARGDGANVTVKCEKQQVAALGQFLERLLQDLPAPEEGPLPTALELLDPVEPVWVVGELRVAWEGGIDRFIVEVTELDETAIVEVEVDEEDGDEDEDDAPIDPLDPLSVLDAFDELGEVDRGTIRLELTRGQALAFSARATDLVAAGRPSCRFCGLPMDPDGHPCPRMN